MSEIKTKIPKRRRRCKWCGAILDRIWTEEVFSEEWVWTGKGYNECTFVGSLVDNPQIEVVCPECGKKIGPGGDFGF